LNYKNWLESRNIWFKQYPTHPIKKKHLRLDLELSYPRDVLSDIPVDYNPNNMFFDDPTECFYVCDDWSVIFEVFEIEDTPHERPTLRMLVESCHQDPVGERIRLMSTSCSIIKKPNEKQNSRHDFAFFRGKFWKVTWNEYFGQDPSSIDGLPFKDKRHLYLDTVLEQAGTVLDKLTTKSMLLIDRFFNVNLKKDDDNKNH